LRGTSGAGSPTLNAIKQDALQANRSVSFCCRPAWRSRPAGQAAGRAACRT